MTRQVHDFMMKVVGKVNFQQLTILGLALITMIVTGMPGGGGGGIH